MLSLSKSYDVNFLSDTLTSFCHIFSRQSFRGNLFFNLNIFLFPTWPPVNLCRTSNTCHKIFQSRLISCQNSHLYRRLPFILRNFFNVILTSTVCCQLGFGNNNHPSLFSLFQPWLNRRTLVSLVGLILLTSEATSFVLDNLVVTNTLSSFLTSYALTYSENDFKSLNFSSSSLGLKAILGNALFVLAGKTILNPDQWMAV